jgi:hypothetical protein
VKASIEYVNAAFESLTVQDRIAMPEVPETSAESAFRGTETVLLVKMRNPCAGQQRSS